MTNADARDDAHTDAHDDGEPAASGNIHPPARRRTNHFAERARHAFLFTMWAEPRCNDADPLWRFSLQEVENGARHGFGSLDALVEFLQARMVG